DLLTPPDSRRSDALYIAQRRDDEQWTELNKGKAVLYIHWNGDQWSENDRDWQMGSPALYRDAQGGLGAVASANNSREYVYVWDASDTTPAAFANERRLKIASEGVDVHDPFLEFDN